MNEFAERSNDKKRALSVLYGKAVEYYKGDESFGVLMAYERAALEKGAVLEETEEMIKMARDVVAREIARGKHEDK